MGEQDEAKANEIATYRFSCGFGLDARSELYVTRADHMARVAALQSESAALRREVEALREWIRVVCDAADHVTWEQRGAGTIVHIITELTTRPLFNRPNVAAREPGRSEA